MNLEDLEELKLPNVPAYRTRVLNMIGGHNNMLIVAGTLLGFNLYDHVYNFDFGAAFWLKPKDPLAWFGRTGFIAFLLPIVLQVAFVWRIETLPAHVIFNKRWPRIRAILIVLALIGGTLFAFTHANGFRGAATFSVGASIFMLHAWQTIGKVHHLRYMKSMFEDELV
ncbi:MAG: hypothetical protein KL839_09505 [Rhizobium sp.]|nr:hypothetical protein [Rhizobium sp.]